jgi:gluconolactonase
MKKRNCEMFKARRSGCFLGHFASALLLSAAWATACLGAGVEVAARGLQFPEGSIFVGNTLYFVDYGTSDVLRLVQGKVERLWHQDGCGANGLADVHGELLVACYDRGTIVRIATNGELQGTISHDDAGGMFVSPNDLATDGLGGVYFSASGNSDVAGRVYYRDRAGLVKMVADGISYANGLAVSSDGKLLYLAESEKHRLLTFRVGVDGALSDKAELVNLADILSDGRNTVFTPDGLRLDKHGRLFVGLYEGGGFAVLTPDGKLIKKVDLPLAHHSNLAISADGRSVYVTACDDDYSSGEILTVENPVTE